MGMIYKAHKHVRDVLSWGKTFPDIGSGSIGRASGYDDVVTFDLRSERGQVFEAGDGSASRERAIRQRDWMDGGIVSRDSDCWKGSWWSSRTACRVIGCQRNFGRDGA